MKPKLPCAHTTQRALDSFFSSSGKLFHVFSRDQVMACFRDVFNGPGAGRNAEATACLTGVAAVGAQYNPHLFEDSSLRGFYNICRLYLDEVLKEAPLQAVKVCTLMAMYNIMGKSLAAVAFVGKYRPK